MKYLYKPNDLLNFLSKNSIKLKKTLSQNFLIDKNILDKIIKISNISKDETILEIGPGIGNITFEMVKKAKKVIAIEKDSCFAKILKDQKIKNLKVFNTDFLSFDLNFLKTYDKKIKVVSAIPYHLTHLIITKLLKHHFLLSKIILIVQKQLAQKISSKKDNKLSGYFSILVNFYAKVKILANISNSCFFPKPKIDSSIIELSIKDNLDLSQKISNPEKFLNFVKLAFSQRRKKLISTIQSIASKKNLIKILNDLNIDENTRAENLSLDNFLALYKKLF